MRCFISIVVVLCSISVQADIISKQGQKHYIHIEEIQSEMFAFQLCEVGTTSSCQRIGRKISYTKKELKRAMRTEFLKTIIKSGAVAGITYAATSVVSLGSFLFVFGGSEFVASTVLIGGMGVSGGLSSAALRPLQSYRAVKGLGEKAVYGELEVRDVYKYESALVKVLNKIR